MSLLALAGAAAGHDFAFTDVRLSLGAGGTFQADVACDLDALALGVDASTDSAALAAEIEKMTPTAREELADRLIGLLKRRLRVRFDDEPVPFGVSLPERGGAASPGQAPSALGLVARLHGRVPTGARSVSFFASRAFPPVRLTVIGADGRAWPAELIERGGGSRPFLLAQSAAVPAALATASRFLRFGFGHILPEGLDHILFVIGLALLSSRWRPLVAQVSAFTLAHTLTLGLAVYGIISLPSRVVEPLIAASVVYVAVENLFRTEASWLRLALVFGFGLLHGLGFAGALAGMGWPTGRRVLALFAFNAGVELAQLAVIALTLLAVHAAFRLGVPRRRLARVLSVAIAAIALVWTVQRLTAMSNQ